MKRNTIGLAVLALSLLGGHGAEAAAQEDSARSEERGWLGFTFGPTIFAGDSLRILAVFPDSPAEEAGIRPGDAVVRVNGRPATRESIRELGLRPGDRVRLRLDREGRQRAVAVVAARRPAAPVALVPSEFLHIDTAAIRRGAAVLADSIRPLLQAVAARADSVRLYVESEAGDSLRVREMVQALREVSGDTLRRPVPPMLWHPTYPPQRVPPSLPPPTFSRQAVAGAEFAEINPGLAGYFDVERGLLTLEVAEGSPADDAGLRPGDVIVEADGESVETVTELREAVARARERRVRLDIVRDGRPVELDLRWDGGAMWFRPRPD